MSSKISDVMNKVAEDATEVKNEVVNKVESTVKSVELSTNEALNILVSAVKVAQKRGAYELEETELILKAVKTFVTSKV